MRTKQLFLIAALIITATSGSNIVASQGGQERVQCWICREIFSHQNYLEHTRACAQNYPATRAQKQLVGQELIVARMARREGKDLRQEKRFSGAISKQRARRRKPVPTAIALTENQLVRQESVAARVARQAGKKLRREKWALKGALGRQKKLLTPEEQVMFLRNMVLQQQKYLRQNPPSQDAKKNYVMEELDELCEDLKDK